MARLLCVHPHPDDESIACGGLIASALVEGHEVLVVTCTGGEEGENQSGIDLGGRDMAAVRRDEMAAAIAALGHPAHEWLGYRDSGMAETPSNDHERAFVRADVDEAAGRLAASIRRFRPDVVISDDEQGTYGHPDHVRANRVTARAVALAADPGWGPDAGAAWRVRRRFVVTFSRGRLFDMHRAMLDAGGPSPFGDADVTQQDMPFGVPDAEVTTTVDVRAVLDVKRAAMAAHRSQVGPESFFLNTPDDVADLAFGIEEFALRDGDAAHPTDVLAEVA